MDKHNHAYKEGKVCIGQLPDEDPGKESEWREWEVRINPEMGESEQRETEKGESGFHFYKICILKLRWREKNLGIVNARTYKYKAEGRSRKACFLRCCNAERGRKFTRL